MLACVTSRDVTRHHAASHPASDTERRNSPFERPRATHERRAEDRQTLRQLHKRNPRAMLSDMAHFLPVVGIVLLGCTWGFVQGFVTPIVLAGIARRHPHA